ncbi:MAG: hypothetical protein HQL30_12815, partial [Candidatus Omnitrophica bacterium]|nr:hypothetical protein [Candidatus Omnitrophota bacterium]
MENVWEKALLLLKSEVNDQVFSSWFSPIRQFSVADDVLTLAVPNKFFENWIRENYENDILSAIRKTSGRVINIKFIATETASPAAAEKP